MKGPDPYELTAMNMVTGAMCMLEEYHLTQPQDRGGVLTPGYAFWNSTFCERMEKFPWGMIPGREAVIRTYEGMPDKEYMLSAIKALDEKEREIFNLTTKGKLEGIF